MAGVKERGSLQKLDEHRGDLREANGADNAGKGEVDALAGRAPTGAYPAEVPASLADFGTGDEPWFQDEGGLVAVMGAEQVETANRGFDKMAKGEIFGRNPSAATFEAQGGEKLQTGGAGLHQTAKDFDGGKIHLLDEAAGFAEGAARGLRERMHEGGQEFSGRLPTPQAEGIDAANGELGRNGFEEVRGREMALVSGFEPAADGGRAGSGQEMTQ